MVRLAAGAPARPLAPGVLAPLAAAVAEVRARDVDGFARLEAFERDPEIVGLRRELRRLGDAETIVGKRRDALTKRRLAGCDPTDSSCHDHSEEVAYDDEARRLREDPAALAAELRRREADAGIR